MTDRFTCPECGDPDAHHVGTHHEIVAVYICGACGNRWEEQ